MFTLPLAEQQPPTRLDVGLLQVEEQDLDKAEGDTEASIGAIPRNAKGIWLKRVLSNFLRHF